MRSAGCLPPGKTGFYTPYDYESRKSYGGIKANHSGVFLCGDNWNNGSNAGAFTLNLNWNTGNTNNNVGFRCARYSPKFLARAKRLRMQVCAKATTALIPSPVRVCLSRGKYESLPRAHYKHLSCPRSLCGIGYR